MKEVFHNLQTENPDKKVIVLLSEKMFTSRFHHIRTTVRDIVMHETFVQITYNNGLEVICVPYAHISGLTYSTNEDANIAPMC